MYDWSDATSSSRDFPPEDTAEPFCDVASVDTVAPLPLRLRSLYFSIASMSRSRMRFATGDRPGAAPGAGARLPCGAGLGDGTLRILLLPTELADG